MIRLKKLENFCIGIYGLLINSNAVLSLAFIQNNSPYNNANSLVHLIVIPSHLTWKIDGQFVSAVLVYIFIFCINTMKLFDARFMFIPKLIIIYKVVKLLFITLHWQLNFSFLISHFLSLREYFSRFRFAISIVIKRKWVGRRWHFESLI